MSNVITKCHKCGSNCLWFKPDGSILCQVCMTHYSNEDATLCNKHQSKIKMSDVDISKHYDYFMGERRPFWRADYKEKTIVTLCRTKAECLNEVREWIGKQDNR